MQFTHISSHNFQNLLGMSYHYTNITDEQTKYFDHSYPISKW